MSKTYTFVMSATVSVSVEVEAETLEDAIDAAVGAPSQSLCSQCAKGNGGEWSLCSDLDFNPEESQLTEVWEREKEVELNVPLDQLHDLWPGRIR